MTYSERERSRTSNVTVMLSIVQTALYDAPRAEFAEDNDSDISIDNRFYRFWSFAWRKSRPLYIFIRGS